MTDQEIVQCWFDAAEQPPIDRAIRALHDEIARETAELQPRCETSGRCCRFESYGHRLYLTGLETAWCLLHIGNVLTEADIKKAEIRGTCPFLIEHLCSIHPVRPIACRIFFCDPRAQYWQRGLTERTHQRLRDLHRQYDIPYRYDEWRRLLRMCTGNESPTQSARSTQHSAPLQQTIRSPDRQQFVQVRIR